MPEAHGHRRKRIYGSFICEYPGCKRVFNRADHLSRHKRNHEPQKKLKCPWPSCTMSFARNDVKEKHHRRHSKKQTKGVISPKNQVELFAKTGPTEMQPAINHQQDLTQPPQPNELILDIAYRKDDSIIQTAANLKSNNSQEELDFSNSVTNTLKNNNDSVHSKNYIPISSNNLSPSDLIEWLFHEDVNLSNDSNYFDSFEENNISMNLHDEYHNPDILKEFTHDFTTSSLVVQHLKITDTTKATLAELVDSLVYHPDFTSDKLERCLEIYWLLYHPQYPILHRTSFSTTESNPLLLLAMIMAGAGLAHCTGEVESFEAPLTLAGEIAQPLRWMIFAHAECKPPARVWVIQSLLILESYEITSASRFLHERAYLHHGMKVQLLRRSPILGGEPSKNTSSYKDGKQWIQVESMKRATLMAFYLDTVHATVYGHMVVLYAHQIRMELPCDDEIWESDKVLEVPPTHAIQPKFLATLKKLLHREPVKTSAFGKKILLAGLLTIVFQMQQKDLQLSFLEWNSMKESWKQTISLAVDVWRLDICSGEGCCDTSNSLYFRQEDLQKLPPTLRLDDKRCKFGLYHIAQIYMRISHHDYIIYSGAPSRMNVKTGITEYKAVEERVKEWASNINGGISVVHAYIFLFEMLLSPENSDICYNYYPNSDPLLHRRNIMASAMLVIFCYNYVLEGPEADCYEKLPTEYLPDKEDGHSYLRRMKREMSVGPGGPLSMIYTNSEHFHESIKLLASNLRNVKNKNHTIGLLKLFFKAYMDSNWEIGREYSRLFKSCIERCLGRKKITCDDMYASSVV